MLQLLSLDLVATALGVSRHTVRSFVRQGRLRPTRVCRRLLFDPTDVEEFVRKAQGAPPAHGRVESMGTSTIAAH
jgi:excisionase family DNA binding protein